MTDFEKILRLAQTGNEEAIEILLKLYSPLLHWKSIIDERMDEDLYQELCITFLRCIRLFRIP